MVNKCMKDTQIVYLIFIFINFIQNVHMKFFFNKRQTSYCYLHNNVLTPLTPWARAVKAG